MKTLSIVILALLTTACATTGYQEPTPTTGNGLEPCAKKECLDNKADTDPR